MKKLFYVLAILTVLLLPVQSAFALGPSLEGRVIIGQNFTLKSGETLTGDLVIIGGQAVVEQGARVQGDTVVIGGNLQLNGQVSGDAVVIGGLVSLGSTASLAGDAVTIGGSVQRAEGAKIGGNILSNFPPPSLQLPSGAATETPPLPPQPKLNFDFGPLGTAASVFFQALGLGALGMLLTVFLHPQLDRVAQAVSGQPFISGSIGVLAIIATAITAVILSVTLILIPVALATVLLVVLAWLFGIVALGMEVGDRFTKAIHRSWEPVLSAGLGTFLLALVVGMVNLIPCVGWLAPVIVGLIGLGAAVITMFGTRVVPRPPAAPVGAAIDSGSRLPPAS
jgi:cytoskeletal protein CcmA (bactofilin family)